MWTGISLMTIYGLKINTWMIFINIRHYGNSRWHYTLSGLKLVRLTIPGVGKDVETLELSYTSGRNIKWDNHFLQYKIWQIIFFKHTSTIWYSHSIHLYLPKRNESTCLYKMQYMNVHRNFISNALKHKIIQIPSTDE